MRKCPACGEKGISLSRVSFFGEVIDIKCNICISTAYIPVWSIILSSVFLTLIGFASVLGFFALFGVYGLVISFVIWVLMEIVRPTVLPLKLRKRSNREQIKKE